MEMVIPIIIAVIVSVVSITDTVDKYYKNKFKKEIMIECVKVKPVEECTKIKDN
jgi:hypothetical protein